MRAGRDPPPAPRILTVAMRGSSHRVRPCRVPCPTPRSGQGGGSWSPATRASRGRWLTLWLEALGAEVSGFSRRDGGDVTDAAAVRAAVRAARPEVVFHLASLATVQLGYEDPAAVYAVNVVGTANVLQALREVRHVRAVVGVTSDKCYLDQGAERAYREDDRLGGYDPYSSSKAAQELVIAAFRDSLRGPGGQRPRRQRDRRRRRHARPAGARPRPRRADRRADRVRAPGRPPPLAARPQPARGLLLLAERLAGDPAFATAFNFGPDEEPQTVGWIAERVARRGRAGSTSAPPSTRRATRPRSPASTPPAPAPASAGRRHGTSRPRST